MSSSVVPSPARKRYTVHDVLEVLSKHLGTDLCSIRDNLHERSSEVSLILSWLNNYSDNAWRAQTASKKDIQNTENLDKVAYLSTGEFNFFVTYIETHVPSRCPDLDLGQYSKVLFPTRPTLLAWAGCCYSRAGLSTVRVSIPAPVPVMRNTSLSILFNSL